MTPAQRKRMVGKRETLVKFERKRMVNYLTEQGVEKPSKLTTVRMRKKYWEMKKNERRIFDSTPNHRYKMTNTERNRAKRRRQKLRAA